MGIAIACGGQAVGYGFNYSGNVGADLSFTYATGSSSPSVASCTGDNAADAASASTMGLGVSIPAGPATIALDYESNAVSSTVESTTTDTTSGGYELSASVADIADGKIIFNMSSASSKAGDADATTRLEQNLDGRQR